MSGRAEIGTVTRGTLITQDLINAFVEEIRRIRGNLPAHLYVGWLDYRRMSRDARRLKVSLQEEVDQRDDFFQNIMDELNSLAPPFCYFGTNPGDGSDFGFWPCESVLDRKQQEDAIYVSDMSEVPGYYRGFVFHVNDHGNVTLYRRTAKNKDREIWSIV